MTDNASTNMRQVTNASMMEPTKLKSTNTKQQSIKTIFNLWKTVAVAQKTNNNAQQGTTRATMKDLPLKLRCHIKWNQALGKELKWYINRKYSTSWSNCRKQTQPSWSIDSIQPTRMHSYSHICPYKANSNCCQIQWECGNTAQGKTCQNNQSTHWFEFTWGIWEPWWTSLTRQTHGWQKNRCILCSVWYKKRKQKKSAGFFTLQNNQIAET